MTLEQASTQAKGTQALCPDCALRPVNPDTARVNQDKKALCSVCQGYRIMKKLGQNRTQTFEDLERVGPH